MLSYKPGSPTPNGFDLNLAQLARARSYSYRLFSQLYLQGVTAVSLPYIQQIPELTAVTTQPFNADAAAASHHELFQFNVFAYESFFLSEDGLVGGEKTAVVGRYFSQHDFNTAPTETEADDLGRELAFFAFLTGKEADAWEAGTPEQAAQLQAEQQTFLQTHLLCWAPACLLAIQSQADAFFAELARLTLSLLLEHFEALATTPMAETAVPPASNFLPPAPNILANDKTGFKEIARYLLLPAFSGIYLSRDNIGQLGRQFELPRGFGSREMMLLNLLRTAVQYEALSPLLTALQKTCQEWQTSYQQLANTYPKAAPFLRPWQERAAATEQMIAELMSSSSILE